MIGGKRLTKAAPPPTSWGGSGGTRPAERRAVVRNRIAVPYHIKSVIVGLLLSDANMQLNSPTANARLMFEQSFAHFEYFWHVFIILSPYCLSYPRFRARLWHNSVNFSLTLVTIALPCLTSFPPPMGGEKGYVIYSMLMVLSVSRFLRNPPLPLTRRWGGPL
jgi:hypothetical protein